VLTGFIEHARQHHPLCPLGQSRIMARIQATLAEGDIANFCELLAHLS
jgi:hypothetical protein